MDNQTFVLGVAKALAPCCFTRTGYTFAGWALSTTAAAIYRDHETVKDLAAAQNETVVLYAVWVVTGGGGDGWTACDVEFDALGGAVDMTSRTITSGAELESLPTPTKDGAVFEGWYTEADGGVKISGQTIITMSARYYARWKENSDGSSGGGAGGGGASGGGTTGGGSAAGVGSGGGATGGGEVVGEWIAGHLDTSFAKAQVVMGALYGRDGVPVGTVQVKAGKINKKKGTVKISASATLLVDGKAKKVAAKAVEVAAAASARLAGTLALPFKAPIGDMAFEMEADGTFRLKNGRYTMVEKSVGGNWSKTGAKVWLAGTLALPAGTIEELLPDGEPVIPKAGKWSFAKAASVKYAKDKATGAFELVIDDTKGTNRSAMKLSYAPKTGIFNGSFKIYAIQDGKLKKFTVKVAGVVVDGKGWGRATGPGGASYAVTVE